MHKASGFTLIEILIVAAIIGVLALIAWPAYQDHIIRSQITAALADISPGKTLFESRLLANGIEDSDIADVGLLPSTTHCSSINLVSGETGHIECALAGHPMIQGRSLRIQREAAGQWYCVSPDGVPARYLPPHCL